ncbi:ribosome silencing factor [Aliidiomarina sedimenti]|uniref:Ribosomal silencing factor RsfS n=2 Tax=Aliidiomarina TaxID=1249554 RepID=A0A432WLB9_9GAMM|nr:MULTISPECIES: ribosome silencing factor [Aliidiomarina]RUO32154.1 ribosome silencing factor [Aliidiomarina sedimenti]RUO34548.1 ribosome silencing factor [Aliidiomarina soli]
MQGQNLRDFIVDKVDDLKARDVKVLDVSGKSDVADFLVICSGNSKTHVRGIANHVALEAKHGGFPAIGIEGELDSEWVLVDFGDVILHVMQDTTRDFYQLEKLWGH